MSYEKKIECCFGVADLYFAGHPSDAQSALELLKDCYDSDISMKELLNKAEAFLKLKGANSEHIAAELEKIREKFSGWLNEGDELP